MYMVAQLLEVDDLIGYLTTGENRLPGVCSTDLRLDTSKNGLKQVYTSPETIY
jgi:hypothetical protein